MAAGAHGRERAGGGRRRRRGLVTLLLVLGSVAALGASFAWWLDRQALSPGGWQVTSGQLIASPPIRRAIGSFAIDELFGHTGAARTVRTLLPSEIADPLLARVHALGLRLAAGILASGPARRVWTTANRQAHGDLLAILDDRRRRGDVALNLTPLLIDLVRALDASAPLQVIPRSDREQLFSLSGPPSGELVILTADQVDQARIAVNVLRGLSVVLAIAAAALLGAGIALAGGWRAVAVAGAGAGLVVVAAIVLLVRSVLAPALADALVSSSTYRPAARAAWSISTTQLRTTSLVILVLGGALIVVGVAARAGRRA